MIEERMDNLLDGIRMMNYNAINISDTLDTIHKKILINLDRVEHNSSELKGNQKRLDEAAKYVSKPSCIMNIVIALLLGLIAFLVVKIIWFP
jgi:capsular polysaccharide biosynthesis protein